MSHDVRMRCIDVDIVEPRNKAFQTGALDKSKEPFSIRSKKFWPIENSAWVSNLPKIVPYIIRIRGCATRGISCLTWMAWVRHTHGRFWQEHKRDFIRNWIGKCQINGDFKRIFP